MIRIVNMICSTTIFIIALLFNLFSCNPKESQKEQPLLKPITIKSPDVVAASNPTIVRLDTCPPPYYVVIPVKDSVDHVYNTTQGPFKIKLGPPTVAEASFFIDMPLYNDEKGLAINSIMSGFQDKSGCLWFGTNGGGITRYDGNSSVTFTAAQGLGNNQVRDMEQDSAGNLWMVQGGGGVVKFDGKKFTSYTTKNGLAHNEVRSVTISKDGKLWFGTYDGGISIYDGKDFTTLSTANGFPSNKIWCSLQDKKGVMWFGSTDSGLIRFDGKMPKVFGVKDGLPNNVVRSVMEDSKGNLWVGTEGGVSKFDGQHFMNFTTKDGLPYNSIHSIVEDESGNLWFGTYGGGVCRFNGRDFFIINSKQGLPSNIVVSIVKDKSGNLWFGSFSHGGVNYYRGTSIISFTKKEGLPDNGPRNILRDSKGNLWIGTNEGGVCRYDGRYFTYYKTSQGLYQNRVHAILEDRKGNIWFGTNGGASKYDGRSFTNYTSRHGLGREAIRHILEDSKGNLWFCSELGGITQFDGVYFTSFSKKNGLPGNDARAILEDSKGNYWIGTHGGGVCRFDGKSFMILNTEQGLTSNSVISMRMDSGGNIWVCTVDKGINIIRKGTIDRLNTPNRMDSSLQIFENFTMSEGLADNSTYDVAEDKKGNVLIGTNLGITLIKHGLPLNSPINKDSLEYYHWKVGYPIKDVNSQAMYTDKDGAVWIGTNGLVRFDYSQIHKDTTSPLVVVKRLKVNNEDVLWNDLMLDKVPQKDSIHENEFYRSLLTEEAIVFGRVQDQKMRDSIRIKFSTIEFDSITPDYPVPIHLRLPFKFNDISFEFGAIETGRPALVHYQYMLSNYNKDWNPISTQTTATFGNIHEGNYTFKVKAQSPEGVWSQPVEYHFTVLPPIGRTWWAISLYILAALGLLGIAVRYRVASVRKKEREKAKHEKELLELEAKALRAQMNPHFIFNCLNSIKSLMQEQKTEKGVTYLTTFSKLIRTLFNNADKKEISLHDEIETCKLYLQLEAMRFDTKFSYSVNIDDKIDLKSVQVPALIIQPFIENAIWHGIVPRNNGGHVSLDVVKKDSVVEIIIDDNGIGRESSQQNKSASGLTHQSKGVNLTQSRLELNNLLQQRQAVLEIVDKKDGNGLAIGTTVIIKIKEEQS